MSRCDLSLFWKSAAVARAVARKGIHDRSALSRELGLPQSTVHQNFDADWAGRVVSISVLVALAKFLDVPLATLVYEPRSRAPRTTR